MAPRLGVAWRIGALMTALVTGLVSAGIGAIWLRTWSLAGPALDQAGARLGWALGLGRKASVEFSVLRQRRDDLDDWVDRGWIDLVVPF